jgi:hypothetical protein
MGKGDQRLHRDVLRLDSDDKGAQLHGLQSEIVEIGIHVPVWNSENY